MLYIAVVDEQGVGSNYNIVFKIEQNEYYLRSGVVLFSNLHPQQKKIYSYHLDDPSSSPTLNIYFYKGNFSNLTTNIY
jgi:hypothetical protein